VGSEALSADQELGPFKLIRCIAKGGMAEIWLADERKADQRSEQVALKILSAQFAHDQTFHDMFGDEVRIASHLTHENIVRVHGAFEIDGHLIQSMELIEGKDLRRILSALARQGESFPVPLALLIAREVARALSYAHTRKSDDGKPLEIVHRDISPHNLMITVDGGVKLLDFGIAKAAERLTRTRLGVIKGKVSYMAPEQALAVGVSPKTDIFSLGIVLWEMLAMRKLFVGETDPVILERVVRADVPPIQEYNASVPEEASALLRQMLAQRAPVRPESARVVENALTRILMRHFKEGESSRESLAAWAARWIDDNPTAQVAALDLEGTPDVSSGQIEGERREGSRSGRVDPTIAMRATDTVGASGAQAVLVAPAIDSTLIPEQDRTLPDVEPSKIRSSSTEDSTTDPVRLPTRSEIQRAVDAVITQPVLVDAPSPRRPDFAAILAAKAKDSTLIGSLAPRDSAPTPMEAIIVPQNDRSTDETAAPPSPARHPSPRPRTQPADAYTEPLPASEPPPPPEPVTVRPSGPPMPEINRRLLQVVWALAVIVVMLGIALAIKNC
jgi:hypothetical protein